MPSAPTHCSTETRLELGKGEWGGGRGHPPPVRLSLPSPRRFVLVPSLHPDWTLLLFLVHTHSTVTATLALLFVPKVSSRPAHPA